MKRSILILFICIISCIILGGCSKKDNSDVADKLKKAADSAKEQKSEKETKKTSKKKKNKEEAVKEEDIPEVLSGEALYYDGKVIFRVYSYTSYEFGALFGEFSHTEHAYQPNSIYAFDPKSPDKGITKLCDDYGYGNMYLINGEKLYSQYTVEGHVDDYNSRVYKRHMPDGEPQEICSGEIKGFSPDGKHFVVYSYTTDVYTEHYYIYSTDDTDIDTAHRESGSFLGMDNEAAYFLEENDGGTFDVIKLTNDGREYYLASCDYSSVAYFGSLYPVYDGNISFSDGKMSFQVDFYEGTGHFYSGSIKTTVLVEAEGSSFDTPLYDPELEEVIPDEDPDGFAIDPESVIPKQIKDIAYDYPAYDSAIGTAHILQYYEVFDEGVFYTMALCHRDPLDDVGWRESYSLQNLKYYFMPDGKTEPVLLHTMFEPLGSRGWLGEYEYYEKQPTVFAYAQLLTDDDGTPVGLLYETINVEGPEMPVVSSDVYNIAPFSDEFYYEHPHGDDIYEDFDVEGIAEFIEMIVTWDNYSNPPVKIAKYDDQGELVLGENFKIPENDSVYMCHIAFDDEGRVYYIRPVIME